MNIPACMTCGTESGRRRRRRCCDACYGRWKRARFTGDRPPPAQSHAEVIAGAVAAHIEHAAGRREDYCWLRDEHRLTLEQAANRVGVTRRTAFRWEVLRRQEAAA